MGPWGVRTTSLTLGLVDSPPGLGLNAMNFLILAAFGVCIIVGTIAAFAGLLIWGVQNIRHLLTGNETDKRLGMLLCRVATALLLLGLTAGKIIAMLPPNWQ